MVLRYLLYKNTENPVDCVIVSKVLNVFQYLHRMSTESSDSARTFLFVKFESLLFSILLKKKRWFVMPKHISDLARRKKKKVGDPWHI